MVYTNNPISIQQFKNPKLPVPSSHNPSMLNSNPNPTLNQNQNQMYTYNQFLSDTFNKILKHSFQDQALTTLSQLQNKEYYLGRVQEIFSQIYVGERESKIRDLIQDNQKLNIVVRQWQNKSWSDKDINKKQPAQKQIEYVELPCQKCKDGQIQSNSLHIILKKNQSLAQQLSQLQQSHQQQLQLITISNQKMAKKLNEQLEKWKNYAEKMESKIKQINSNLQAQTNNRKVLAIQLDKQRTKNLDIEIKNREFERDKKIYQDSIDKSKKDNQELRQCNSILEDKIRRLQSTISNQQQKVQTYQKQLQTLGEQAQNLHSRKTINAQSQQGSHGAQCLAQETNRLPILISTLTQLQLELKKLSGEKFELLQQKSAIQREFMAYRNTAQDKLQSTKSSFRNIQSQFEAQIQNYRQKQRNGLFTGKLDENKDLHYKISQLKQRMKACEQQKCSFQTKYHKLSHTNQVLLSNYEQITQSFRQQKTNFHQKLSQFENSQLQYEISAKQIATKYKNLQEQSAKNQKKLNEKNRFLEEKIINLQKQIEKMGKIIKGQQKAVQKFQKQEKQRIANDKNNLYLIREHENLEKIGQLEKNIQAERNGFKQLNNQKQKKINGLKNQILKKQQKIVELAIKLQKEQQNRVRIQKQLVEMQSCIRHEQQKLIKIQQKNREEIIQMVKIHDMKLSQLSKQYEQSYSDSSNYPYRCSQNGSHSLSKALENDLRSQIQNLTNFSNEIQRKNISLQSTIQQLNHSFGISAQKCKELSQQIFQLKNKQAQHKGELQKYKDRELTIVRNYEDRIKEFSKIFKEFRKQISCQMTVVLEGFKSKLAQTKVQIIRYRDNIGKYLAQMKINIEAQIYSSMLQIKKKNSSELHLLQSQHATEMQIQSQQLNSAHQSAIRSKTLQILSTLAEKQFLITELQTSSNVSVKKYKQLENLNKNLQEKLSKVQQKQGQFREIVEKMEGKVDEAEKKCHILTKQFEKLQRQKEQIEGKSMQLQSYYKKQLKQCRQKYRQQNERIFNRYEREFNKIISLNNKKMPSTSVGGYSLSAIASSRGIGVSIPTKGHTVNNAEDDKIVKLKKQIQEQKRLVQQMESSSYNIKKR